MTITIGSKLSFLALVLGLGLSGCAAPEKAGVEPAPEETVSEQPVGQNSRINDALASLPPVDMLPPERAMREGLPGPEAPDPDRLIGLAAADIQKLFGAPDFRRHDPPAEIWQYRKDGCLLDIFLYQGKNSVAPYRVTHVHARGRSVAEVSGTDCLLETLAR